MTKSEFCELLSRAYDFPQYYGYNLDAADELLEEMKEEDGVDRLSLEPLVELLFAQASDEDREIIWEFLGDHFTLLPETYEEEE